ncbi:MAG: histone deacetylase [Candidatus Aminicenantes bacterium]|nr:histone deacetylase [Candidatus Aminicenantes bacterium]
MKTGFIYDDDYLKHDTGFGHPEKPQRLNAITDGLQKTGWYEDLVLLEAREADVETVCLAHDEEYVKNAKEECEAGYGSLSSGDTNVCPESYSIALKAVGGALAAVDAVVSGKVQNAFCAVRPPGHHATRYRGMGFCVFNNIAIAARCAQEKYNLERILIADWDVHHGNGTQDIFYENDRVFFMSTHQSPLYPGTGARAEIGAGKGKGFTMNRPFPAGAGNKEIIDAFRNDFLSAAKDFKPDLTLLSAGFDSHVDDPLGGLRIDGDGFRELTRIMLEIADINGKGRLISILEGGYSLENLSAVVPAHIEELRRR